MYKDPLQLQTCFILFSEVQQDASCVQPKRQPVDLDHHFREIVVAKKVRNLAKHLSSLHRKMVISSAAVENDLKSTSISVYLYICISIYLYIYISVYLYIRISIYLYIYISVFSIYLYIYISVYLYICISIYLYIYISVYLYIYISV